jgi:hypothetical protein
VTRAQSVVRAVLVAVSAGGSSAIAAYVYELPGYACALIAGSVAYLVAQRLTPAAEGAP